MIFIGSRRVSDTSWASWAAALAFCGGLLGAGNFVFPYLSARDGLLLWSIAVSVPLSAMLLRVGGRARAGGLARSWLIPGCGLATLTLVAAAESWWPNSADEYGYLFLTRTLLHLRLWNPPPPAPDIFDVAWIFVRGGKWFSQYPPGWPAVLALFDLCGVAWLANPLLTAWLAWLFLRASRALGIAAQVEAPLAFLTFCSPFVLFNGASLFPHTLTACLVLAILVLSVADEGRRSFTARLGIGAAFGALLLTRYDVFLLTVVPFMADRVWRLGARLGHDLPAMAAGGAPFLLACLAYDRAITGHAFKTPYAWVSQGAHIGVWGKHVPLGEGLAEAALRTAHWAGELAIFTSLPLIGLTVAACLAKLRARTLRWHDVLLPSAAVFFFFYPATGGHEFGPRYWFFAWPPAMLGVGEALGAAGDGWLRVGRRRLHAPSLATAHLAVFLGVCASVAAFNHIYVDARRLVLSGPLPPGPALVMIPMRQLVLGAWQTKPITAWSEDFARNGVDLSAPTVFARADDHGRGQARFQALACGIAGRRPYLWRAPRDFEPVNCSQSPP